MACIARRAVVLCCLLVAVLAQDDAVGEHQDTGEVQDEAAAIVSELDQDKDGKISLKELHRGLTTDGEGNTVDLSEIDGDWTTAYPKNFDQADADRDGLLDHKELITFLELLTGDTGDGSTEL